MDGWKARPICGDLKCRTQRDESISLYKISFAIVCYGFGHQIWMQREEWPGADNFWNLWMNGDVPTHFDWFQDQKMAKNKVRDKNKPFDKTARDTVNIRSKCKMPLYVLQFRMLIASFKVVVGTHAILIKHNCSMYSH